MNESISTLLVANRGEIALRVMRTARSRGLKTVAVYSQADAHAPHVAFADVAVCLGPPPVGESYLRGDRIIDAARDSGADAIHPGYGFLSENADFARAVADAGLLFVGPPAAAVEIMGDKAISKRHMIEAGVPCIPGYEGTAQDDDTLLAAGREVGFPLMVKAAAGGGGRGMRLVTGVDALADALALARSEALNAFGSEVLILEKAIEAPRHVEVQVFADAHGNVVHLGERDCSVQRRHQKVIEEAPCPVMTPELRERMGAAATEAARAVDYRGAGTVEFLLDGDGEFYFLEMNTRLQVEHPVTELITGLDLVALQLDVAEGKRLPFAQEDVTLSGHAIEVRYYAEDPTQGFLPSTGPVLCWEAPSGEGVRVDAGIISGGEVSPYYDAMVAKIIGYGADRETARRRLVKALEATALFGPATNRDFLIDALERPDFVGGLATTAFIDANYEGGTFAPGDPEPRELAMAAVMQHLLAQEQAHGRALAVSAELLDWSSSAALESRYRYGDSVPDVTVRPQGARHYQVAVGEQTFTVALTGRQDGWVELVVDGERAALRYHAEDERTLRCATARRTFTVCEQTGLVERGGASGGGGNVRAPMHGLLLSLAVGEGDAVQRGDKLAVLEAMKMQHEILAEVNGTVTTVRAGPDSQLGAGDLILEIEPA